MIVDLMSTQALCSEPETEPRLSGSPGGHLALQLAHRSSAAPAADETKIRTMLIALSGRVELNACVSPFPPRVRAGGCPYRGIWTSPVRVLMLLPLLASVAAVMCGMVGAQLLFLSKQTFALRGNSSFPAIREIVERIYK